MITYEVVEIYDGFCTFQQRLELGLSTFPLPCNERVAISFEGIDVSLDENYEILKFCTIPYNFDWKKKEGNKEFFLV